MLYALRMFDSEPETMLLLAQIAISAWLSWQGEEAPLASDLGGVFDTEGEWIEEVKSCWGECSAGRPYTIDFEEKAICFWKTVRKAQMPQIHRQAEASAEKILTAREGLALLRAKDPKRLPMQSLLKEHRSKDPQGHSTRASPSSYGYAQRPSIFPSTTASSLTNPQKEYPYTSQRPGGT